MNSVMTRSVQDVLQRSKTLDGLSVNPEHVQVTELMVHHELSWRDHQRQWQVESLEREIVYLVKENKSDIVFIIIVQNPSPPPSLYYTDQNLLFLTNAVKLQVQDIGGKCIKTQHIFCRFCKVPTLICLETMPPGPERLRDKYRHQWYTYVVLVPMLLVHIHFSEILLMITINIYDVYLQQ